MSTVSGQLALFRFSSQHFEMETEAEGFRTAIQNPNSGDGLRQSPESACAKSYANSTDADSADGLKLRAIVDLSQGLSSLKAVQRVVRTTDANSLVDKLRAILARLEAAGAG